MKKKPNENSAIGRRQVLPILGTGLLLPLLPASASQSKEEGEQDYVTLLKPDGSAVRVKASKLKKSIVVKKNISNGELLKWLGKDGDNSKS